MELIDTVSIDNSKLNFYKRDKLHVNSMKSSDNYSVCRRFFGRYVHLV